MGRRATTLALLLAGGACGGRSALLGAPLASDVADASAPVLADAAIPPVVDASLVDVPSFVDEAAPASDAPVACSAPTATEIGECVPGDPSCCKFGVSWTCGSQSYRAGGGCGPPDGDGGPSSYDISCTAYGANGSQESTRTVNGDTANCPCGEPAALAAFVQDQCGE